MEESNMDLIWQRWDARRAPERGQGLVEYALIIALIAIVVIAVVVTLGGNLQGIFTSIGASV